jgi:UDP-3-O-[3-hydroxymyristoyl] N-acetylglucosamine deacetylase/3-hydroxyacyl-[acyl-carrier-protein] dehydratase
MKQATIDKEVSLEGVGIHTGNASRITLKPAEPGAGIVFVRTDLDGYPRIPARVEYVSSVDRGTTLSADGVEVHTVEHLLAAIRASGVDNLVVEIDADEPPGMDGSALPFLEILDRAGLRGLDAEREVLRLEEPFHHEDGGVGFLLLPAPGFKITFHIEYDHPLVGNQVVTVDVDRENFRTEVAPARTFCFEEDVEALEKAGLIRGGSLENAIVIGKDRILNEEKMRFKDEFVRHKVLDLIGDLTLLGPALQAHVIATRSGHPANVGLVRRLARDLLGRDAGARPGTLQLDINQILEILPHRYPFILVDRILEMEVGKRAVGIKNVTINEPFFVGHFPGHPIMPGVLQIEAMGQVGGLLLMNSVPDPENKVVYFIALDNIRFRKPVRPGDRIRFELEMLKLRGRTCKMKGVAYVDGARIAEAEMMAMVMDK